MTQIIKGESVVLHLHEVRIKLIPSRMERKKALHQAGFEPMTSWQWGVSLTSVLEPLPNLFKFLHLVQPRILKNFSKMLLACVYGDSDASPKLKTTQQVSILWPNKLHQRMGPGGGFLLLTQRPRVWFSTLPKTYFDVAEIYQWRWLEESGQRLENVDPTHLGLASGKLVLPKSKGPVKS